MKKFPVYHGRVFRSYEIDLDGNVTRIATGKKLQPFDDQRGYNRVDLMIDGEKVRCKLHLMMAETFMKGRPPEGCVINHKDGNKHNNALSNLEYATYRDNTAHQLQHIQGLHYLTKDEIKNARAMKQKGVPITEIAKQLDCPYYVIRDMLNGKTYKSKWDENEEHHKLVKDIMKTTGVRKPTSVTEWW